MIRRQMGSHWLLITQDDHARLAGELAAHIGNHLFERPEPHPSFVQGVTLHDCGWPIQDDQPTLSPAGEPLDVFETPLPIALRVWSESTKRAAAADERAGLLVSLHNLALSMIAAAPTGHERSGLSSPASRFELNKFQHRQVELQEKLRLRLGLGTDLPLNQGLALGSDLPAEQAIVFQFRLLQAMDALSLAICCTKPPVTQIRPVLARPGGRSLELRVVRSDEHTLLVSPWPFDVNRIKLEVPFRRLAVKPFSPDPAGEKDFQAAYTSAPQEQFKATLSPRR
jgi:hypothetical protein